MPYEQTSITTPDGECPLHVFTAGPGRIDPAIIFYMDAGGIRPAVLGMAERLSQAGYVVVLPDLFYRYGPYGPLDPVQVFKGDVAAVLGPLIATTSNAKAAEDTGPILAHLAAHPDVKGGKVGALGFCMGGGMAIASAGAWPSHVAAVASFHGGNLVTDAPDSPHNAAGTLQAELYIAAADQDASYPPVMARQFEAALDTANIRYHTQTYPAAHGWMMPDFPVFNKAEAEHGWRDLLAFFSRTLR